MTFRTLLATTVVLCAGVADASADDAVVGYNADFWHFFARAGFVAGPTEDAWAKTVHKEWSGRYEASCEGSETPFLAQCRGRAPLVVNADNDHYFKAHNLKEILPLEERLSEVGAHKYIDLVSKGGRVTHLFACAIGQRADYDSKACDPIWLAIEEAKARGEQPDEWPVNAKRLHDQGVDLFKIWCAYGRQKGLSVWISQRMNDVHGVDRPWNMRTNRFWYEHPEFRRSHGVDKALLTGLLPDNALNYAFPEVREFEFGIFRELVDRYDADGFELDFMRFWQHLTPGREREEAPILTAFIRRCREYANAKAKERGHPILLSSRVPSSYEAARTFGFDPEEWARQGLLDLIVVANFWATADYDFDFAGWCRRLAAANPRVTVLPCVDVSLSSGVSSVVAANGESLRGWADNVYAEGAKGLYLFNVAYLPDALQQEVYSGDGFSASSVAASSRRYIVSYHDCTPKGMPDGRQLPVDLAKGGSLKVRVGSISQVKNVAILIGFLAERAVSPVVYLNGEKSMSARPVASPDRFGGAKSVWACEVPARALKAGDNVLTLMPQPDGGCAIWAEIDIAGW